MDLFLAGVKALLVRHACIGKASVDEGYARFAIEKCAIKSDAYSYRQVMLRYRKVMHIAIDK